MSKPQYNYKFKGGASIDEIGELATPKQVIWLHKTGHPSPETATFDETNQWFSGCFGERRAV